MLRFNEPINQKTKSLPNRHLGWNVLTPSIWPRITTINLSLVPVVKPTVAEYVLCKCNWHFLPLRTGYMKQLVSANSCVGVRHLAYRPEENGNWTKGFRQEIFTTLFSIIRFTFEYTIEGNAYRALVEKTRRKDTRLKTWDWS